MRMHIKSFVDKHTPPPPQEFWTDVIQLLIADGWQVGVPVSTQSNSIKIRQQSVLHPSPKCQ